MNPILAKIDKNLKIVYGGIDTDNILSSESAKSSFIEAQKNLIPDLKEFFSQYEILGLKIDVKFDDAENDIAVKVTWDNVITSNNELTIIDVLWKLKELSESDSKYNNLYQDFNNFMDMVNFPDM